MSQLKFWAKQNHNNNNNIKDSSNNNNDSNATNGTSNDSKHGKRNWLHTPEALMNGHVVYLVKFFGNLPVEQAKGIEVVKETIRKLQFAQQMKKAETGTQEKHKKVEITISCDGVAVQEPRTNNILHQFPLHNISYCADEKGVKKFFSFIAKSPPKDGVSNGTGGSSNGSIDETHECFVFISNKLASDITLTIGQAFDLAYKKFMNNAEKSDLNKANHQISDLEKTIAIYKSRLTELSQKLPKNELDGLLFKLNIKDILELPSSHSAPITNGSKSATTDNDKMLIDTSSTKSNSTSSANSAYAPIVPPRNNAPKSNSQKMEELLLNSDSDSDFDPRADESMDSGSGNKSTDNDLFGFEPSKTYGQQLFFNNNDNKLVNANNNSSSNSIVNTSSNSNILSNMNSHSFMSTDLNLTPPLLAPPPKVAAPRRSTSTTGNGTNAILANGSTDLFGSDPFDITAPSIFQKNTISVDDFSLESLDPLRK